MTIAEFCEKYRLWKDENGLVAHDVPASERSSVLSFAKERREDIEQYLAPKQSDFSIIESMSQGLSAIRKAAAARDSKVSTLASMESHGATVDPQAIERIERKFKDVIQQYPMEYTYYRAKRLSESGNKWRRLAGARAVRKLLNGEPWERVSFQMEKEWRDDLQKDVGEMSLPRSTSYSVLSRGENGARRGGVTTVLA